MKIELELEDNQVLAIVVSELKEMLKVYEADLELVERGTAVHHFVHGYGLDALNRDAEKIREKLYSYEQVLSDFTV